MAGARRTAWTLRRGLRVAAAWASAIAAAAAVSATRHRSAAFGVMPFCHGAGAGPRGCSGPHSWSLVSARPSSAAARRAGLQEILAAGDKLEAWDNEDRAQKKAGGPPGGLAPAGQIAGADELRSAAKALAGELVGVTLGVMAPDGASALKALASWTSGLGLRGCRLGDEDVDPVDTDNQPADRAEVVVGPVYVKYRYTREDDDKVTESAYMKPYPFAGRGVLFHPELGDGEMRMYGDLPLALFDDVA